MKDIDVANSKAVKNWQSAKSVSKEKKAPLLNRSKLLNHLRVETKEILKNVKGYLFNKNIRRMLLQSDLLARSP